MLEKTCFKISRGSTSLSGVKPVEGLPPVPNQQVAAFLVERPPLYFGPMLSTYKVYWEPARFRKIVLKRFSCSYQVLELS